MALGELQIFHDSSFEAASHIVPHGWISFQLIEQGFMVDVVEAPAYVCINYIFGLRFDMVKYGFDSIMTGPSWSEPVAVRFEFGFPFRF